MVKRIVHAVKKFLGSKEECGDECCRPAKKEVCCDECCAPPKRKTAKKATKKRK
jgi:hypothetical protein